MGVVQFSRDDAAMARAERRFAEKGKVVDIGLAWIQGQYVYAPFVNPDDAEDSEGTWIATCHIASGDVSETMLPGGW